MIVSVSLTIIIILCISANVSTHLKLNIKQTWSVYVEVKHR